MENLKCSKCENEKLVACYSFDSANRKTHRLYCKNCRIFVGAMIKKQLAEDMAKAGNYQLKEVNSISLEQFYYERTMRTHILPLFQNDNCKATKHHDIALDKHKIYGTGAFMYRLFCQSCLEEFSIYIAKYTTNKWLNYAEDQSLGVSRQLALQLQKITKNIIDLTPFQPEPLAHKIPHHLLAEYNDYIHSEKWQRKKNIRLAMDLSLIHI